MADNTNIQASAYTAQGTARASSVALPEATFDGIVNMPVMHQAVKAFLANQRQGNAATKTRELRDRRQPEALEAEGHRPRASGLDPRAALGGRWHGVRPARRAATTQYVPRQVRALARKSALNARAREDAIIVIDAVQLRRAADDAACSRCVARLGVADKKVLILTDGVKPNVFLSGRNLPNVHVMPYSDGSTYHILWSDVVLIEAGAIGQTLEPVKEDAPAPAPKRVASPRPKWPRVSARPRSARRRPKRRRPLRRRAAKKAEKKSVAKKTTAKKSAAKKSTKKKEK